MSSRVTIPDVLNRTCSLVPDKTAVKFDNRELSYRLLAERAARVANLLRYELEVTVGARFGLLARNTAEFPEIYFGAALAGCVCVPINYRLSSREVGYILADAAANVLIADTRLENLVEQTRGGGFDGRIVWIGEDVPSADSYKFLIELAASRYSPEREIDDSDVVLQMYTSGTTGFPKGAMLSHRSLLANSWSAISERNLIGSDLCLLTSPLSHLAAGARIIMSAHVGATLRIDSGFDAERVLRLITQGDVTTGVFVPTMVQLLLEANGDVPIPSGRFRRLTYGSAPMPRPLLTRAIETLHCEFQQGYGLTEASPNVAVLPPEDHVLNGSDIQLRRLDSVGRPTIGVQVRVVDDEDRELPAGAQGEIAVRGANVMEGYWRKPEETAATLRGGWLHTGDLGTMDANGYLYLVDRRSFMLVSGGLNVYPREIEVQLEAHPGVLDVAVSGRPDQLWGETPVAFVVLRPGSQATVDELANWCRNRLAGYKVPKDFYFVASLPRSSTGKVLRRQLTESFRKKESE